MAQRNISKAEHGNMRVQITLLRQPLQGNGESEDDRPPPL